MPHRIRQQTYWSLRCSCPSALLQLHHSRLNTWLQWTGQRQLHDGTSNIYGFGFGATHITGLTIRITAWRHCIMVQLRRDTLYATTKFLIVTISSHMCLDWYMYIPIDIHVHVCTDRKQEYNQVVSVLCNHSSNILIYVRKVWFILISEDILESNYIALH